MGELSLFVSLYWLQRIPQLLRWEGNVDNGTAWVTRLHVVPASERWWYNPQQQHSNILIGIDIYKQSPSITIANVANEFSSYFTIDGYHGGRVAAWSYRLSPLVVVVTVSPTEDLVQSTGASSTIIIKNGALIIRANTKAGIAFIIKVVFILWPQWSSLKPLTYLRRPFCFCLQSAFSEILTQPIFLSLQSDTTRSTPIKNKQYEHVSKHRHRPWIQQLEPS